MLVQTNVHTFRRVVATRGLVHLLCCCRDDGAERALGIVALVPVRAQERVEPRLGHALFDGDVLEDLDAVLVEAIVVDGLVCPAGVHGNRVVGCPRRSCDGGRVNLGSKSALSGSRGFGLPNESLLSFRRCFGHPCETVGKRLRLPLGTTREPVNGGAEGAFLGLRFPRFGDATLLGLGAARFPRSKALLRVVTSESAVRTCRLLFGLRRGASTIERGQRPRVSVRRRRR
mmetsp:Transcript_45590/g.140550  ORF Transcript_45590/g.140550 Transcript_45590/m.140550 type:complete len:230 (-) Transcript_45590:103-792(-)